MSEDTSEGFADQPVAPKPDRDPTRGMTARHSSANDDHLTPLDVVDRARVVLFGHSALPSSAWRCGAKIGNTGWLYTGWLCPLPPTHLGEHVADAPGSSFDAKDFIERASDAPDLSLFRGRTFDLDPATDANTNADVRALRILTAQDDALSAVRPWRIPNEPPPSVFLNPPGGKVQGNRSSQKLFWRKLSRHYSAGEVRCAFYVCFSLEALQSTQVEEIEDRADVDSEEWRAAHSNHAHGRPAIPLEFPICYASRRVRYDRWSLVGFGDEHPYKRIRGDSPPHASCFVLLPDPTMTSTGHHRPRDADHGALVSSNEQVARFSRIFSELGHVVVPERWI